MRILPGLFFQHSQVRSSVFTGAPAGIALVVATLRPFHRLP